MKKADATSPLLSPSLANTQTPGTAFSGTQIARTTVASASGKAILVGEHAVVYGARAVAMPVRNLQMSVRLTPTQHYAKSGEPLFRVTLGGRSVSEHLRGVLGDAFRALEIEPFPLDLDGHSTVLIGAGLGSSASLCIVVLKALAEAVNLKLAPRQLAALGNNLERRFHGNPSGLDTAVVAMGQVIAFVKGEAPEPVSIEKPRTHAGGHPPWRFVLLDSGARSSTLAMIQAAAPYFTGVGGDGRLARFDEAALDVVYGLGTGDESHVADAMNRTGAWLTEAGIVNAEIAELIDSARTLGCLAAKPTGAGGGGCVIALLDSEKAEEQLRGLRCRLGAGRVYAVELP